MDGDEGFVGAGAEVVNGVGVEFFAGAAGACEEDCGAGGGDLFDGVEGFLEDGGFADDVLEAELVFDLGFEGFVFFF